MEWIDTRNCKKSLKRFFLDKHIENALRKSEVQRTFERINSLTRERPQRGDIFFENEDSFNTRKDHNHSSDALRFALMQHGFKPIKNNENT